MNRRRLRAAAALLVTVVALAGCAGLPTTGQVSVGLPLGQTEDVPITQVALGPEAGAGPEQIVAGFLEAGITPAEGWSIASKFLTPELAERWRPSEGVIIDAGVSSRVITSDVESPDKDPEGEVLVQLEQVASVDSEGAYAETRTSTNLSFHVERDQDGEWRISAAPDGIVLDAMSFDNVFAPYSLKFYDSSWSRLVPDVRWYPRRPAVAATIVQAVIDGPSPWLAPAVFSAFPADVLLAKRAVPIDADQVAEVALNRVALGLDQATLARMRTQLERSLSGSGVRVSQVRFTVDGQNLGAGEETITQPAPSGTLVLTPDAFGTIVGDEVEPIPGVSEEIRKIGEPLSAVEVFADDSHAAVQFADGSVWIVGGGRTDELDAPPGLIAPSVDPFGYTWTVPADDPQALSAWTTKVNSSQIAKAWPEASTISHLRVSEDGARVAAQVNVGGQEWLVVAGIIRDKSGLPTEVGPMEQLTHLDGPGAGIAWLGPDMLGVLVGLDDPVFLTQMVGGPSAVAAAPVAATSIAGGNSVAGVRILDAEGIVFARRGSAWQETVVDVTLLATRAGQ